jgi:hypothetical protein
MDMADWFSLLQSISICLLLITPPLLILLGFDYTQYMYVCLFCMSCRHNGIGEERIHQGTGCLTCFTSADAYTREATRTYDCVPSTNISPRVESSCHNIDVLAQLCPARTLQRLACRGLASADLTSCTRPTSSPAALGDSTRFRQRHSPTGSR